MDNAAGEAAAEELLRTGLLALALPLEESAIDRLLLYLGELIKWNRRVNLISRQASFKEIVDKHFLDSLTLLLFLERQKDVPPAGLLDVGSGAGFPGLVVAAVRPAMEVVLVEPRLKRVSFLQHVVRTLGLDQVQVVAARVEDLSLSLLSINYITSRAVADAKLLQKMTGHLLDQDRGLILMLGGEKGAENHGATDGGGLEVVDQLSCRLPLSGDGRRLVLLRRPKPTVSTETERKTADAS